MRNKNDEFLSRDAALCQSSGDFVIDTLRNDAVIRANEDGWALAIGAESDGFGVQWMNRIGGFGVAANVAVKPDRIGGSDVHFRQTDCICAARNVNQSRCGGWW